ncbi:MAG: hypothetical protein QOE20_2216 [Mycobacterium sp.]|jgi:hypothetical protein|nr:hypothetical protein [Mycobacterium sp.]
MWHPVTYERLVRAWQLDDETALGAVEWVIAKLVSAIRSGELADADRPVTKRPKRRPSSAP